MSLLIGGAQRARCQAETPLIALFRFSRPALTIDITFLGADKKTYKLEISAQCAALTLAAIAAHLGEILSILPEKDHPPMQPIVAKTAQTAMRDNGALALILTLESGAELPVEFQGGDLAGLSEQFAELAKLANRKSRH